MRWSVWSCTAIWGRMRYEMLPQMKGASRFHVISVHNAKHTLDIYFNDKIYYDVGCLIRYMFTQDTHYIFIFLLKIGLGAAVWDSMICLRVESLKRKCQLYMGIVKCIFAIA